MLGKKGALKNFSKFKGKYLRRSLSFNSFTDLSLATLLKKRLHNRCFPVNFATKDTFFTGAPPVTASVVQCEFAIVLKF